MPETQHPKHQSEPSRPRDLVKPGSTIDQRRGGVPAQQGQQQGQQGVQPWPQQTLSEDDQKRMQERQQQAWDLAAEREKSNNPATKKARTYDKNAPGMHPANQPAPDTKLSKGTRLDLEDLTGNPGHRGVNPDAPAGSINGPPDDKTGRTESINEPSHIDQNMPPVGLRNQPGGGAVGSINEPPGSQVIPPGAGQGAGGAGGGVGTEYGTPEIESLEPDEAEMGGDTSMDMTVTVRGSGFTDKSKVMVEGEDVGGQFVSDSEMTFPMSPGAYAEPGVVEVVVANGGYKSEPVEFELLEADIPASSRQSKRTKSRPQGKNKKR